MLVVAIDGRWQLRSGRRPRTCRFSAPRSRMSRATLARRWACDRVTPASPTIAPMRTFPELVSIGYEGRDVDELIRQLGSLKVNVLVDVRLNPISRKRGMSKSALAISLQAAGIRYVHHRELGNPKDNRDAYRSGDRTAYVRFEEILGLPEATSAIKHVTELLDGERVALLCFERDHDQCHRALVVEAIRQLEPRVFVHQV